MGLGRDACYQLLKCMLHNGGLLMSFELLTIFTFWKQKPLRAFHQHLAKIPTKQLAAVVDVIFTHMRIRKYPISLGAHEIH